MTTEGWIGVVIGASSIFLTLGGYLGHTNTKRDQGKAEAEERKREAEYRKSVEVRKNEIAKLQTELLHLNDEHAALKDDYADLIAENADLKRQLALLGWTPPPGSSFQVPRAEF